MFKLDAATKPESYASDGGLRLATLATGATPSTGQPGAGFADRMARDFLTQCGRHMVALAGLDGGHRQRVLDVGCAFGATACVAARALAPGGSVLALDKDLGWLSEGRSAAAELDVSTTLRFVAGEWRDLLDTAERYDAILLSFGMAGRSSGKGRMLADLVSLLRPGGRLLLSLWEDDAFEPANRIFWRALQEIRPDLYESVRSCQKLGEAQALKKLAAAAQLPNIALHTPPDVRTLTTLPEWWCLMRYTDRRDLFSEMTADDIERLRQTCFSALERWHVQSVVSDVIFAVIVTAQPALA